MPKIIPELRERILDYAKTSFKETGYEGLSIRSLASDLGIATGTLYNYFPNKLSLFQSILMDSWDDTFKKIDAVIQNRTEDKLLTILEILYKDMEGRGAIASTLFKTLKDKSEEEIKSLSKYSNRQIIEQLLERLKLLGGIFDGEEGFRTTQLIIGSLRIFLSNPIDRDIESEVEFLFRTVINIR